MLNGGPVSPRRRPAEPVVAGVPDDLQKPSVLAAVAEVRGVHVPVRIAVGGGHVVGQRRADGDLDALEGVHDDQAQRAVEDVEVEHVVEGGAIAQAMVRPALLEGDRVGG